MKLPFQKLKDLVPGWSGTPEELADLLTFSGTEVEGISDLAGDRVLECAVTSNRVDCLGWLGLARDVAAVRGLALAEPVCEAPAAGGPTQDVVRIDVEDPAFCPRYVGLVVEGVRVGPSPAPLAALVERMGLRPVNNVVDATNVVMFELNQPLHAFDLDRLRGGRIVVRRGRTGERLKAINAKEYALDPSMGLICDGEGPVAIAGVMGGADSEVSSTTTRLLIESAFFDPATTRRTSRKLQLKSDASYRFERGIDAHGAMKAALRVARLIMESAGGTLRKDGLDVRAALPTPAAIPFRVARFERVCGVAVAAEECRRIFAALGCAVAPAGDGAFSVTPPTWRRDLFREIDLIEEVVRTIGLHRVPMGAGLRVVPVKPHPERRLLDSVRDRCVQLGLLECVTPTFVDEGAAAAVAFASDAKGLKARNPIRAGEGAVRRSLLPSLLVVRTHNQDQGNDRLRLFEAANAAFDAPTASAAVDQVPLLGALLDTVKGDKVVDGDVRDGRGFVEELCESLGVAPTFAPSSSPHLRADRQIEVRVDGKRAGVVGVVAPAAVEAARLRAAPVYVELDLRAFVGVWKPVRTFAGLPKFPATVRDLAFVLDETRTYAELEAALRGAAPRELEAVAFFDEFRGAQLGAGKKSLALTLTFRSDEGTLDGAAVDAWVAAVVKAAETALGATLRK
jgi:phenylalanyl-tRNA synthetase beta chain